MTTEDQGAKNHAALNAVLEGKDPAFRLLVELNIGLVGLTTTVAHLVAFMGRLAADNPKSPNAVQAAELVVALPLAIPRLAGQVAIAAHNLADKAGMPDASPDEVMEAIEAYASRVGWQITPGGSAPGSTELH